jgi:uncharacterized membrane protein YozB (DUF420 family)
MDAHLLFWSLALANMALLVAVSARGVQLARRGRYAAHRRAMRTAAALVVLFLVAYAGKRSMLGAEDLTAWSGPHRVNLWVHESFVAAMLLAGGVALLFARRLGRSRLLTGRPEDPLPGPDARRRHRRAGWAALVAAGAGLLTAAGILAGMIARAGP